ncbi:hypothetical protein [Candidatus Methylobacter oryzae]|uniref:Uncharacterized protein n=1 Tax=Candidatus Methylobacter oryzae TaxID=2497749 RepID=A0ABY3CGR6_9GAMM|nr:hypothetical protein [Candidatus Methylobacter oryzae]TRX02983.1 hypothetical protein EKO24_001475 [Candidatus Methylobacter oryzae]
MRNLLREQRTKQELELREQEAKRLEDEHWAETRKLKEELSVIAAPSGWGSQKTANYDDQLFPDMVVDGACNRNDVEPANTKNIQLNSNDIEFSGLLNIPKKIDDWFEVIDAMTKDFFNKNGTIPTKAQAWSKLWASPPDGYGITTGKDRGENCLKMAELTLTKINFNGRWKSYTTPKSE